MRFGRARGHLHSANWEMRRLFAAALMVGILGAPERRPAMMLSGLIDRRIRASQQRERSELRAPTTEPA
jgi:hypothetical protein